MRPLSPTSWLFFRIQRTAAGGFLPAQHGVDHRGGTSYPGTDLQGFGGAVLGTGATFHASVPVHDVNLALDQAQDPVGAHQETHPAPDTFLLIEP